MKEEIEVFKEYFEVKDEHEELLNKYKNKEI